MDKLTKMCALYLATLNAISIINRLSHWTTKGKAFYGDHLLFDRIYTSAAEDMDAAAEKFVGIFGDACLDYDTQTDLLHRVLLKYNNLEGSPQQMSLAAEKDFLKFSETLYKPLEDEEKLTIGLDNAISEISDH